MRLRLLAASIALVCCASVAQAGSVYGSSATPGGLAASPDIVQTGASSNMDSAPDGTATRFRNNLQQSGAEQFTVSWDVTGAEGNIKWRLFVLNRTDAQTSIQGVSIMDDGGRNASSSNSLVINTGAVASGTITMFELVGFQTQGDYDTVDAGFNWANITQLVITFQLNNPFTGNPGGTRTTINIDAVSNPEPGTLALFGLGLLGLGAAVGRRRRRTTKPV